MSLRPSSASTPDTALPTPSTQASTINTPLIVSEDIVPGTSTQSGVSDVVEDREIAGRRGEELGLLGAVSKMAIDNQVVINTFVAGGLAGATSRTVVSPLERLKIILQCQAVTSKATSGQAYAGVWPSLVRMWREEGLRGFLKGNGINVVRILPYSALQFTSYGGFKTLLKTWSGQDTLSTPLRLTAGAGAGIVAVCATYPLDLVRARLSIATANMASTRPRTLQDIQAAKEDARLGMLGMTKKVYKLEGGVRGLYRGCWATAVGVAPYVSLNFYIYESLKAYILPHSHSHPDMSEAELVARKLGCGALAGGTSLLFTHPFDVLRRKLQIAGMGGGSAEYNGAIDAMRHIIRTEGFWKGMYRGLVPNLIKVTPSIAVSFYTFETVRDLLARWEDIEEPEDI